MNIFVIKFRFVYTLEVKKVLYLIKINNKVIYGSYSRLRHIFK